MIEFDQKRYDFLIECERKKDFSEWNSFLENNKEHINLTEADFSNREFKGCNFSSPKKSLLMLEGANFTNSNLYGMRFDNTSMQRSNFSGAFMDNCCFVRTNLSDANFENSIIKSCKFPLANLINSNFKNVKIEQSNLYEADFTQSNLTGTHFRGFGRDHPSVLSRGESDFKVYSMNMCGTLLLGAKMDNETYFSDCYFSIETDFRTIYFEDGNYATGLKQTLKYCNRKHNWEDWYKERNPLLGAILKIFWFSSNYGYSMKRIVSISISTIIFFSFLYLFLSSSIHGLESREFIKALYFSTVTLTTVGYGDMYPINSFAQCVVMTQIIMGYFFLGSLITVLSNLFTADAPPKGLIKHPLRKPELLCLTSHIKKIYF